eukprot:jgi/Mesvir1/10731/Mv13804-RA.2
MHLSYLSALCVQFFPAAVTLQTLGLFCPCLSAPLLEGSGQAEPTVFGPRFGPPPLNGHQKRSVLAMSGSGAPEFVAGYPVISVGGGIATTVVLHVQTTADAAGYYIVSRAARQGFVEGTITSCPDGSAHGSCSSFPSSNQVRSGSTYADVTVVASGAFDVVHGPNGTANETEVHIHSLATDELYSLWVVLQGRTPPSGSGGRLPLLPPLQKTPTGINFATADTIPPAFLPGYPQVVPSSAPGRPVYLNLSVALDRQPALVFFAVALLSAVPGGAPPDPDLLAVASANVSSLQVVRAAYACGDLASGTSGGHLGDGQLEVPSFVACGVTTAGSCSLASGCVWSYQVEDFGEDDNVTAAEGTLPGGSCGGYLGGLDYPAPELWDGLEGQGASECRARPRLLDGRSFAVFFVAVDAVGNVQTPPAVVLARTRDITPPAFLSGTPLLASVNTAHANISLELDEPSTVYYAVTVADASVLLSSAEVKSAALVAVSNDGWLEPLVLTPSGASIIGGGELGVEEGGVVLLGAGWIQVPGGTGGSTQLEISGLPPGTMCALHAVAEDSIGNLQDAVVLLPFNTSEPPPPPDINPPQFTSPTPLAALDDQDPTGTAFNISFALDEPGLVYFTISRLPDPKDAAYSLPGPGTSVPSPCQGVLSTASTRGVWDASLLASLSPPTSLDVSLWRPWAPACASPSGALRLAPVTALIRCGVRLASQADEWVDVVVGGGAPAPGFNGTASQFCDGGLLTAFNKTGTLVGLEDRMGDGTLVPGSLGGGGDGSSGVLFPPCCSSPLSVASDSFYAVHVVAADLTGNLQGAPRVLVVRTPDVTPPAFLAGSPSVAAVTRAVPLSASLRVQLGEPGTAYALAWPRDTNVALLLGINASLSASAGNATGSTDSGDNVGIVGIMEELSRWVKAAASSLAGGQGLPELWFYQGDLSLAGGKAVVARAAVPRAGADVLLNVTGLASGVAYVAWVVAEDVAGNLQGAPWTGAFLSADVTVPTFLPGYPRASTSQGATGTSVAADVGVTKASRLFYVVITAGATRPSPFEVKAGKGAQGVPPYTFAPPSRAIKSGSLVLAGAPGGGEAFGTLAVTGLVSQTRFEVCMVLEDVSGNLSPRTVALGMQTLDITPPRFLLGGSPLAVPTSVTSLRLNASMNEPGTLFFLLCPTTGYGNATSRWVTLAYLYQGATPPPPPGVLPYPQLLVDEVLDRLGPGTPMWGDGCVPRFSRAVPVTLLGVTTFNVTSEVAGLRPETLYVVVAVAADVVGNIQSEIRMLAFRTPDVTPPSFLPGSPSVAHVSSNAATLHAGLRDATRDGCNLYYLLARHQPTTVAQTPPTPWQVRSLASDSTSSPATVIENARRKLGMALVAYGRIAAIPGISFHSPPGLAVSPPPPSPPPPPAVAGLFNPPPPPPPLLLCTANGCAGENGGVVPVGDWSAVVSIKGLLENQRYELHLVADDAAKNLQPAVVKMSFRTADVTPPRIASGPSLQVVAGTSFLVAAQLDEPGTLCLLLLPGTLGAESGLTSGLTAWDVCAPLLPSLNMTLLLDDLVGFLAAATVADVGGNATAGADLTMAAGPCWAFMSVTAAFRNTSLWVGNASMGVSLAVVGAPGGGSLPPAPPALPGEGAMVWPGGMFPPLCGPLGSGANYTAFVSAVDRSGNLRQGDPVMLPVQTLDVTPPSFLAGTPFLSNVTSGGLHLTVTLDEPGQMALLLLPLGVADGRMGDTPLPTNGSAATWRLSGAPQGLLGLVPPCGMDGQALAILPENVTLPFNASAPNCTLVPGSLAGSFLVSLVGQGAAQGGVEVGGEGGEGAVTVTRSVSGLEERTLYLVLLRAQDARGNRQYGWTARVVLTPDASPPRFLPGFPSVTPWDPTLSLELLAAVDEPAAVYYAVTLAAPGFAAPGTCAPANASLLSSAQLRAGPSWSPGGTGCSPGLLAWGVLDANIQLWDDALSSSSSSNSDPSSHYSDYNVSGGSISRSDGFAAVSGLRPWIGSAKLDNLTDAVRAGALVWEGGSWGRPFLLVQVTAEDAGGNLLGVPVTLTVELPDLRPPRFLPGWPLMALTPGAPPTTNGTLDSIYSLADGSTNVSMWLRLDEPGHMRAVVLPVAAALPPGVLPTELSSYFRNVTSYLLDVTTSSRVLAPNQGADENETTTPWHPGPNMLPAVLAKGSRTCQDPGVPCVLPMPLAADFPCMANAGIYPAPDAGSSEVTSPLIASGVDANLAPLAHVRWREPVIGMASVGGDGGGGGTAGTLVCGVDNVSVVDHACLCSCGVATYVVAVDVGEEVGAGEDRLKPPKLAGNITLLSPAILSVTVIPIIDADRAHLIVQAAFSGAPARVFYAVAALPKGPLRSKPTRGPTAAEIIAAADPIATPAPSSSQSSADATNSLESINSNNNNNNNTSTSASTTSATSMSSTTWSIVAAGSSEVSQAFASMEIARVDLGAVGGAEYSVHVTVAWGGGQGPCRDPRARQRDDVGGGGAWGDVGPPVVMSVAGPVPAKCNEPRLWKSLFVRLLPS